MPDLDEPGETVASWLSVWRSAGFWQAAPRTTSPPPSAGSLFLQPSPYCHTQRNDNLKPLPPGAQRKKSYDVSADTLEPVATLLGPRTLSDMQVWGGYAYVVWGNALMSWPLDVSDPQAEPQVVQVLGLSHAGWELTLGGGLAFLKGIRCALSGCTTYGVYVLELSDPVRPATIASSAPGRAVLVSGDRVIDVSQGLTVRDGAACVAATPEARLLWWPISPAAGEPVHFEDASTHLPSTWSWSFGDGGTNETQNPTHTFSEGGYYEVVLTVSNRSGTHTVAKTVWVRDVFRHLRGRVGR